MARRSVSVSDQIMADINKAMGKDVMRKASDPSLVVEYIPTGMLPIDILVQGGIPRGRFTTLQGDWSTLKSLVGLSTVKQVQLMGGTAALIDTEHAFNPEWATENGIDVDDLMLIQGDNGEEALDYAEALIYKEIDLIVFDSIAATLPQAEQGKRLFKENNQPGRQAALFSLAARKLTTANSGKTAVLWTNQMRENIGMSFGPRTKASGGRAMPYYNSITIELMKVGKLTRDIKMFTGEKYESGKEQIGQKFKASLIKSKLNKPMREVWFDWSLEEGRIDMVGFIFAQGVELGMVKKSGNTWSYGKVKAVGRDKFKTALASNAEALLALQHDIEVHHGLRAAPVLKTKRTASGPTPPKKGLTKKKVLSKK